MPGIRLLFGARVDLPTKATSQFVYAHPDATGEVDITGLVFTNYQRDFSATLHMNEITQDTTIRVQQQNLDTSQDDQIFEFTWTADKDEPGNEVIEIGRIYGKGVNVKCTIDSLVAEGIIRNIQVDLEQLVY